jgi:anaerobic selenocysteine-containing dehydrogenase
MTLEVCGFVDTEGRDDHAQSPTAKLGSYAQLGMVSFAHIAPPATAAGVGPSRSNSDGEPSRHDRPDTESAQMNERRERGTAPGTVTSHSFCRACVNSCPMLVDVADGRLTRVKGDPDNPVFGGYACIKGLSQPALHNHPDRLLHSLRRRPDGSYEHIDVNDAMDEVATRLERIVAEYGPRAIAGYVGTSSPHVLSDPFLGSLLAVLGSRMKFSPNTLDKPGKALALAMHGRWGAPLQGYHSPDVALLFGANPLKTYYGAASGNPTAWLRAQMDRGMQLLVVDPRRSNVAKLATMHVQPIPGTDPAIMACMIHVILRESLIDSAFVDRHAGGIEELTAAIEPFTPERVAQLAGVTADELVELARGFAAAGRGYAVCGVGPGFSTSSTLVEYLVLILETLCGHWMREGEAVERTPTLLSAGPYRAQAHDPIPAYGFGELMRGAGLRETVAGLPTGALADEMLLDGPDRVRALLSIGGNPMLAWPDQSKVHSALRSLDLLVQFDPWMSATAREADFVIAPTMFYEAACVTLKTDFIINMPTYYGPAVAHSQYTAAVVSPPPGSEVIPEWQFIWGVARRLGLQLRIEQPSLRPRAGEASGGVSFEFDPSKELRPRAGEASGVVVDMSEMPSEDELIEALVQGGRIPLSEVKAHPSGVSLLDPAPVVQPPEPDWAGRFDLANPDMLRDLANELEVGERPADAEAMAYPFRLISIREQNMNNSTVNVAPLSRGRNYNPAFLHPDDLIKLGLAVGDAVRISTRSGSIPAIVAADSELREGIVAMSFGFGRAPGSDDNFRDTGSPPSRLLDGHRYADPYVGMPRIGNVPVCIEPLVEE